MNESRIRAVESSNRCWGAKFVDGREIFHIGLDGKCRIGADLDLSAVRALPLLYLHLLREIVRTAIDDAER